MSAPKTDMHRLQEAVRLHRLGKSHRRIAQLLSMGRVTVNRYFAALELAQLLDGDPSGLPSQEALRAAVADPTERKPPPQEISSLESWREIITEKRAAGASAQSVHDFLRFGTRVHGALVITPLRLAEVLAGRDETEKEDQP